MNGKEGKREHQETGLVWYGNSLTRSQKFFFFAFIAIFTFLVSKLFFAALCIISIIYGVNVIKKYRNQRSSIRIIETKSPNELRPVELGILYDHTQGANEMISIYFYLIAMKYINIEVIRAKNLNNAGAYILRKTSKEQNSLREYEKELIRSIFGNHQSVEWGTVKVDLTITAKTMFGVHQELQKQGYYYFYKHFTDDSYEIAQSKMMSARLNNWRNIFSIGKGYSLYATTKSKKIWNNIAGFRNYLETVEKDRITFHSDPEKKFIYIDEMMPYAVALGVNRKWESELMGWERSNNKEEL